MFPRATDSRPNKRSLRELVRSAMETALEFATLGELTGSGERQPPTLIPLTPAPSPAIGDADAVCGADRARGGSGAPSRSVRAIWPATTPARGLAVAHRRPIGGSDRRAGPHRRREQVCPAAPTVDPSLPRKR